MLSRNFGVFSGQSFPSLYDETDLCSVTTTGSAVGSSLLDVISVLGEMVFSEFRMFFRAGSVNGRTSTGDFGVFGIITVCT